MSGLRFSYILHVILRFALHLYVKRCWDFIVKSQPLVSVSWVYTQKLLGIPSCGSLLVGSLHTKAVSWEGHRLNATVKLNDHTAEALTNLLNEELAHSAKLTVPLRV